MTQIDKVHCDMGTYVTLAYIAYLRLWLDRPHTWVPVWQTFWYINVFKSLSFINDNKLRNIQHLIIFDLTNIFIKWLRIDFNACWKNVAQVCPRCSRINVTEAAFRNTNISYQTLNWINNKQTLLLSFIYYTIYYFQTNFVIFIKHRKVPLKW